jgi:hypothetical protein
MQRHADTLEKLQTDQDVWVATADAGGVAHLVPLSLCWYRDEVIVATEATNRTVRNMAASGQARLALGPSSDVVISTRPRPSFLSPALTKHWCKPFENRRAGTPLTGKGTASTSAFVLAESKPGEARRSSTAVPSCATAPGSELDREIDTRTRVVADGSPTAWPELWTTAVRPPNPCP